MSVNLEKIPQPARDIVALLCHDRAIAAYKAWDSLARYKFQMFGYWAAIWVHLNRVIGDRQPNPFKNLVVIAADEVTTIKKLVEDMARKC
jgi:hypothetical protein